MSLANGSSAAPIEHNAQPQLNVLAQYIKDLSFENPDAPESLAPQQNAPDIAIQVNINARQISETDFGVELLLEGTATKNQSTDVLFKFELNYGGVFRLVNIPAQDIQPLVVIECPRLLFPFARQIVADCVRNGGFPPLFLDPIDFAGLYQQRLAEENTNKPLF
jgi:preprotein translocase subunit SecB